MHNRDCLKDKAPAAQKKEKRSHAQRNIPRGRSTTGNRNPPLCACKVAKVAKDESDSCKFTLRASQTRRARHRCTGGLGAHGSVGGCQGLDGHNARNPGHALKSGGSSARPHESRHFGISRPAPRVRSGKGNWRWSWGFAEGAGRGELHLAGWRTLRIGCGRSNRDRLQYAVWVGA